MDCKSVAIFTRKQGIKYVFPVGEYYRTPGVCQRPVKRIKQRKRKTQAKLETESRQKGSPSFRLYVSTCIPKKEVDSGPLVAGPAAIVQQAKDSQGTTYPRTFKSPIEKPFLLCGPPPIGTSLPNSFLAFTQFWPKETYERFGFNCFISRVKVNQKDFNFFNFASRPHVRQIF